MIFLMILLSSLNLNEFYVSMDTILSESHCQTFHFREKVHNFFSLYNAFDFPIWIHDANKRENGKSYPPITKYYVPSDEYTQNWVFGFREMDWLKTHIISIALKKICCSAIKTVIIWMCSCVDNNSYLNLIKEQATTKIFGYYLKTQYWIYLTHHYFHLLMSLPSIFYTDTCGRQLLGRRVD